MSWIPLQHGLLLPITVLVAIAKVTAAQASDDEWRPSTRYVSMQPATVPAPGVAGAAITSGAAVHAPACPDGYREETYTVRRPVVETSFRQEQYVRYEPVTTFVPQQVDQGAWVDEQVVRTGRTTTQLRWVQGGWTVDPATGREYWRLPMLRPVRVRQPDKVENVRVWKPNMTTLSVPKVSYQPRVHVRDVPVQTVRYVEERRVRRVPVGSGCLVAPPACSAPQRTFVNPPSEPSSPNRPTPSPCDSTPAGIPAPPAALPQPAIDPRENVPGPFVLPQSQSDSDKIQRTRDRLPDRVAMSRAAGDAILS